MIYLRNTWCSRDSKFFDEYCDLIRAKDLRWSSGQMTDDYNTDRDAISINSGGEINHCDGNYYKNNGYKEFKGAKATLAVQCKTDHERHMCEMLLRKMRGESVQAKTDNGGWLDSSGTWIDTEAREYRATPEREFVVGESYPCVYDDGDIDVFLCSGVGKFTSTDSYVNKYTDELEFIGESLGVIKFK